MIAFEHSYTLDSSGFAMTQTELRSPSLMVVRRRIRGARFSDHLFSLSSRRAAPWPCLRIVLGGSAMARLDRGVASLGVGDALIGDTFEGARWTVTSDDSDTLFITWPEGAACGSEQLGARPSALLTAAAQRLATSMRPSSPRAEARRDLGDLLGVLEAEGIVGDASGLLAADPEPPESFERLAAALGSVISARNGWPMTIDLADALGIGERQLTRLASAYFRSLYLSVDSLGAYLARSRMWLVTAAMTSPGARTDDVARHFGFSSPVALCHAFTAAGLPSPGNFRRAVLDVARAA